MAISFDRKCKCGYPLTGKQRMYCSRLCNHKAAWERRKIAQSQKIVSRLETETGVSHSHLVSPTPTCTQMVGFGELCGNALPCIHYMPPPSLWQRLRKRVAVAWAEFRYLVDEHIGN